MTKLFISHSSQDDTFVRKLRLALTDQQQESWIDSRELRGGDPLWEEIQQGIEEASAYAVLVTPDALQSDWVSDELDYALQIRQEKGKDRYRVIPLLLDGTKLGAFKMLIGAEPLHIAVSSDPGGIEAAMRDILVALGEREPVDLPPTPQPKAEPLEELVLALTDLKLQEQEGVRRASARASLVYEPATLGQPAVHSARQWRLTAPLGPIEAEEMRWYLEQYAVWPSGITVIQERARQVEANLQEWGRLLHEAALPDAHTAKVMQTWEGIDDHARRRFSVLVDITLEAGAPEAEIVAAKEAATALLGLPWELLHDGTSYLFQGAKPTRVRRRLPSTEGFAVPVVTPPIRILLISARPEDDACGYIDHRISALPLVKAMEALPGLVELQVLQLPTLPALRDELDRARAARRPYHVLHFDGHGVYDRRAGLGGLCFEHPGDATKFEGRRHVTVFTEDRPDSGAGLGSLLRHHRIPLVFLEACQTATAEKASESVASGLLKVGVASVVAMSHSLLVETAHRFVAAFYQALAEGKRVGDAMLTGQRALKDDPSRRHIFGNRALRLQDWFVPVLFQEKDDPQLFKSIPEKQTREDFQTALATRLGELPPKPDTGFIGRSRELLALQRLLLSPLGHPDGSRGKEPGERESRYAVIRGQGGEGKTALAAELARWLVRSHQIRRAAFVSVESHGNEHALVDALGQQLVGKNFSAAGDLEQAIQQVERALREQPALLVVDNMESILLPPFFEQETPEMLSEEARAELAAILALCHRLLRVGDTRFVFTSRENLPAPLDAGRQRIELHRLDREDAVRLVERVLDADALQNAVRAEVHRSSDSDAAREEIEELVDAVHCHARTLTLLAPALRSRGVAATRQSLIELMAEMEQRFPGSREQSVFASVELSLQRLSEASRERVRMLGVFHGGVQLDLLKLMMDWDLADVVSLALELVQTGLATPDPHGHLTLNPALCPYLREQLDDEERAALTFRWAEVMEGYADYLDQQRFQDAEMSATLTRLELANLFALLEHVQGGGDEAATIGLTTCLYELLQYAGKPRLVAFVGRLRDAAEKSLDKTWTHAGFAAQCTRIEQQRVSGDPKGARDGAQALLASARAAGEKAYPGADYDLVVACFQLARVLKTARELEQALPLLDEAQDRLVAIEREQPGLPAVSMAAACMGERGECLLYLDRLDEAADAYEEAIRLAEKLGAEREVAIGKGQLGSVLLRQGRFEEALVTYAEAREAFTTLGEPGTVAVYWHQTGMAYQEAGQAEAAENAYRKALQIEVQLGDISRQANTLAQLGHLYNDVLERPKEATAFYRQAADRFAAIGDAANEDALRMGAEALLLIEELDNADR